MITKIIGTGSYLPDRIIDNNFLSTFMETSDEWITSRTGIKERRIAGEETTTFMAAEAGKRAVLNAGISIEEIDLIITATISPDTNMPSTACQVQKLLGAVNGVAFDLNAACSGFLFALNTANAYISAGLYKTILVIGAETLSRITNWEDRGTCILFGDGAGAIVARGESSGRFSMVMGSDGSKGDALVCKHYGPRESEIVKNLSFDYMEMNGQEVFKFAVKTVPESIEQLLEGSDEDIGNIQHFILHQANKRIIQSVAKRLGVSEEKFPTNLQWCGNTSAASIPILLDEMNQKELLRRGDKIVLSGFGGGLTWGSSLIEW